MRSALFLLVLVLLPGLALAQEADTAAMVKRGEKVFLQCRACHSLEQDGRHKVGPNLWGFFGQVAGHKEGFKYSKVLKESGIVWTEETLSEWLEQPRRFLPGNRMSFAGVRKAEDQLALIEYLKAETGYQEAAPAEAPALPKGSAEDEPE